MPGAENNNMPKVVIYTDGACSGNPGPGGYGVVMIYGDVEKELSGGEPSTTNNRMELMGAIRGLEALRMPCEVRLISDSRYLCDGMNRGWAARWRGNGWMRNKKEKALNADLWERLLELCGTHSVRFEWVRGHGDSEYNNRCDELAVGAARSAGE